VPLPADPSFPLPSPSDSESILASRRAWLAAASAMPALAFGASGFADEPAPPEIDLSKLSPKECLAALYAGNQRFVSNRLLETHRRMDRLRAVAPRQTPFAAFLGCADSRVPIEIVFDQGFGDLFVTRIAGNIASSENIGSLEFGTLVLGCKVLYVLGHTSCGAVIAAAKRDAVPGQISGLFQHIRPAVRAAKGDVAQAVIENVRNQAVILAEASPVIAELVKTGKLVVAGGVYDLATGVVNPVDIPEVT
jgi:carbonic anhydrase